METLVLIKDVFREMLTAFPDFFRLIFSGFYHKHFVFNVFNDLRLILTINNI